MTDVNIQREEYSKQIEQHVQRDYVGNELSVSRNSMKSCVAGVGSTKGIMFTIRW